MCVMVFLGLSFLGFGCSLTDSIAIDKMRKTKNPALSEIANKIEANQQEYASEEAYLRETICKPVTEMLENYQLQVTRFERRIKNEPPHSPNRALFQQSIEGIQEVLESLGFSGVDAMFPSPVLRFSIFSRKIPR